MVNTGNISRKRGLLPLLSMPNMLLRDEPTIHYPHSPDRPRVCRLANLVRRVCQGDFLGTQ